MDRDVSGCDDSRVVDRQAEVNILGGIRITCILHDSCTYILIGLNGEGAQSSLGNFLEHCVLRLLDDSNLFYFY